MTLWGEREWNHYSTKYKHMHHTGTVNQARVQWSMSIRYVTHGPIWMCYTLAHTMCSDMYTEVAWTDEALLSTFLTYASPHCCIVVINGDEWLTQDMQELSQATIQITASIDETFCHTVATIAVVIGWYEWSCHVEPKDLQNDISLKSLNLIDQIQFTEWRMYHTYVCI